MPTSKIRLSPPFPASTTTVRPLAPCPNGLPLVFLDADGRLRYSTSAVPQCLTQELSTDRLNALHRHLWWAGLPTHARPLHRQMMLGRSIVPTSEARYHLLWRRQQIFVKPLPEYLLDYGFWVKELCVNDRLHGLVSGFLLSWVWLVRSEVDFEVARKHGSMPGGLEWRDWCAFVEGVTLSLNHTRAINVRYRYGELRIDRLNQIYRFIAPETFRDIVKGYYSGYLTYGNFRGEFRLARYRVRIHLCPFVGVSGRSDSEEAGIELPISELCLFGSNVFHLLAIPPYVLGYFTLSGTFWLPFGSKR